MNPLLVKAFVNTSLGNSSYLIASEKSREAAVIDPERDVAKYIQAAEELGLSIKYGLETHLHADFISGVHELSRALAKQGKDENFQIAVSAGAEAAFKHLALSEGDRLSLGDVSIEVIATPGHSREHLAFLVYVEGQSDPQALFSGGSLIVGGTGRTDLHGEDEKEPLARELFTTIQRKLADLPDDVLVYPTHGAGSFCNTTVGAERVTTIGQERKTNPFFQYRQEDHFVDKALEDLSSFPEYYRRLPAVNQKGAPVLETVPRLQPLAPAVVRAQMEAGVVVIDVRETDRYLSAHIPKSYGIPLFNPLSTWAGWVVPPGSPIILVADFPAELQEAVLQLIRVGFDDLRGYLDGGIGAWGKAGLPLAHVENMGPEKLKDWMESENPPNILDVRFRKEWDVGHLPGAQLLEVGILKDVKLDDLREQDTPLVVHCKTGSRSTLAVSLLEQKGFRNLFALNEGIEAWKHAGFETVQDQKELA